MPESSPEFAGQAGGPVQPPEGPASGAIQPPPGADSTVGAAPAAEGATMAAPGDGALVPGASPADPAAGNAAAPAMPLGPDGLPDPAAAAMAANQQAVPMTQSAPEPTQGFMHFIAQSDIVGKSLFVILIIMSLASWYLIVVKTVSNARTKRRSRQFLNRFWQSDSLEAVDQDISRHGVRDPFSNLACHAIQARDHYARYGAANLEQAGTQSEFVLRNMRKVIDSETAKVESGLTVLASVGSTAPFVGLFGTVWGVYHALVAIGLGGGATIDRIAGPVGEALIMTGLGLAVAIPAVLAFNAFVRRNRVVLSQLDSFAHDLFAFVTTGQQIPENTRGRAAR